MICQSKIDSDFENNKDWNKIKTGYGDNKDLNQVETNYKDNKNNIKIEVNYENNKNNIEIETNYSNNEKSIFQKAAACHNLLLSYLRPAIVSNPSNEIVNIVKFDVMQSSPPINYMAVGPNILTSIAN